MYKFNMNLTFLNEQTIDMTVQAADTCGKHFCSGRCGYIHLVTLLQASPYLQLGFLIHNQRKYCQAPALLAEYCFIITLEQSTHPSRPPGESIKTAFYSS